MPAATSSTAAASTGPRRTIRIGRCSRPGSTGPTLASYTKRASATKVARIIQTNAAGDNIHLIDPATNKVVEVIRDIEVPHGVTSAPDGSRMYFTNEALHTLDAVDSTTLAVIARVHLSGRPNNVAISNDGKRVYVGIAQQPGAVDVIDTVTLTNAKTIPVKGAIHNVYVTPDGKHVVSGSIPGRMLTVIDQATETIAWELPTSAGVRPMTFDTKPDGSTKNIYIQLSDYHGFAVIDFDARKEVRRIDMPEIKGEEKHTRACRAPRRTDLGSHQTARSCSRPARSTARCMRIRCRTSSPSATSM